MTTGSAHAHAQVQSRQQAVSHFNAVAEVLVSAQLVLQVHATSHVACGMQRETRQCDDLQLFTPYRNVILTLLYFQFLRMRYMANDISRSAAVPTEPLVSVSAAFVPVRLVKEDTVGLPLLRPRHACVRVGRRSDRIDARCAAAGGRRPTYVALSQVQGVPELFPRTRNTPTRAHAHARARAHSSVRIADSLSHI